MTSDQAHKTIQRLKTRYARPSTLVARDCTSGGYCVGGALARGLLTPFSLTDWWAGIRNLFGLEPVGGEYAFPPIDALMTTLWCYNEDIPYPLARAYCQHIIEANDDGDFDRAWRTAETALAWPNPPVCGAEGPRCGTVRTVELHEAD